MIVTTHQNDDSDEDDKHGNDDTDGNDDNDDSDKNEKDGNDDNDPDTALRTTCLRVWATLYSIAMQNPGGRQRCTSKRTDNSKAKSVKHNHSESNRHNANRKPVLSGIAIYITIVTCALPRRGSIHS